MRILFFVFLFMLLLTSTILPKTIIVDDTLKISVVDSVISPEDAGKVLDRTIQLAEERKFGECQETAALLIKFGNNTDSIDNARFWNAYCFFFRDKPSADTDKAINDLIKLHKTYPDSDAVQEKKTHKEESISDYPVLDLLQHMVSDCFVPDRNDRFGGGKTCPCTAIRAYDLAEEYYSPGKSIRKDGASLDKEDHAAWKKTIEDELDKKRLVKTILFDKSNSQYPNQVSDRFAGSLHKMVFSFNKAKDAPRGCNLKKNQKLDGKFCYPKYSPLVSDKYTCNEYDKWCSLKISLNEVFNELVAEGNETPWDFCRKQ